MRTLRRPLALAVGACLLWTAAGCYTGQDWAYDSGGRISPGMTMDEVQGRLGEPYQIIRAEGKDTEWVYIYDSGPGTACIVLMVIFFVVLIVALVASKSKGHVGGAVFFGVGAGSAGPPYHLRLHFDSTGRLLEVSQPYPGP
jgi:outer membrane protein assembly factor BamE (lipoprotein component of BamABCDE complex)